MSSSTTWSRSRWAERSVGHPVGMAAQMVRQWSEKAMRRPSAAREAADTGSRAGKPLPLLVRSSSMLKKIAAGGVAVALGFLLVTNPVVADAAKQITGKQIKNNSITGKDVKESSLKNVN